MFGIGFNEIIIILVIALIVIGPKKLPDIAKALGKGYREFKKAFDDVKDELNIDIDDDSEYDEIRKTGIKAKDTDANTKEQSGSGEIIEEPAENTDKEKEDKKE
jgi:Tat protein translocase TatB subunit